MVVMIGPFGILSMTRRSCFIIKIKIYLSVYVPRAKYEVNELMSAISDTNGHEACAGFAPIFLKRIGRLHPRKEALIRVNKIVRDKVKEKLLFPIQKKD